MKTLRLNIIMLALSALTFADKNLNAGASGTATGDQTGKATLPYGERAKSIFESVKEWTPGQFRNAVEIGEAKALRDPAGNTILHRAIEVDNLPVVELLMRDYGFGDIARIENAAGQSAITLAKAHGDEFAGVFGDMV